MTELSFRVLDILAEPYAAAPQLTARLRITESTGAVIHAIARTTARRMAPVSCSRNGCTRAGGRSLAMSGACASAEFMSESRVHE